MPYRSEPAPELHAIREAVRDLLPPKPWIYWTDLGVTASLTWGALIAGWTHTASLVMAVSWLVASLGTYRLAVLIHEVAHLRRGAVPGYSLAWHVVFGVPFLLPAFLYAKMHLNHHHPARYSTDDDPEYVRHATLSRTRNVAFFAFTLLAPVGLFLRWLVIAPVSLVHPRVRAFVETRLSSIAVNPRYVQTRPEGRERIGWYAIEAACSAWCFAIVAAVARGAVAPRQLLFTFAVVTTMALLNQYRGMAAHRFYGTGPTVAVSTQIADSTTFYPQSHWAELLLPGGARFHALHHMCPALPYHALPEAHRRVAAMSSANGVYASTIEQSVFSALSDIFNRGAARAARGTESPVALVTGASSGFGRLAAVELAARGFRVFGSVRSASAGQALVAFAFERGFTVEAVELDVTDTRSVTEGVALVLARASRLDVLVNNAGIAMGGFFECTDDDELRAQFETNFFGAAAMIRAVLPTMRAQGRGRIVNVSSIGGRVGNPGLAGYCATKWALEGLSESMRYELSPLGIDVVLVEPGTYKTEIFTRNRRATRRAYDPESPYAERIRRMERTLDGDLARREADPREVGRAIADAAALPNPALRYVVGSDAVMATVARWALPQRWFERVLRSNFDRDEPVVE